MVHTILFFLPVPDATRSNMSNVVDPKLVLLDPDPNFTVSFGSGSGVGYGFESETTFFSRSLFGLITLASKILDRDLKKPTVTFLVLEKYVPPNLPILKYLNVFN